MSNNSLKSTPASKVVYASVKISGDMLYEKQHYRMLCRTSTN